jgi:hypothetical protein
MYVPITVYVNDDELQFIKKYRSKVDRKELAEPPEEIYEFLKYIEGETVRAARKKGWKRDGE